MEPTIELPELLPEPLLPVLEGIPELLPELPEEGPPLDPELEPLLELLEPPELLEFPAPEPELAPDPADVPELPELDPAPDDASELPKLESRLASASLETSGAPPPPLHDEASKATAVQAKGAEVLNCKVGSFEVFGRSANAGNSTPSSSNRWADAFGAVSAQADEGDGPTRTRVPVLRFEYDLAAEDVQ